MGGISGWCCDSCPWDMIGPGTYRLCPNCGEAVRRTKLMEVKDRRMRRRETEDSDA